MERDEVPSMIREQRLSRWIEEYSDPILHSVINFCVEEVSVDKKIVPILLRTRHGERKKMDGLL